MKNTIRNILAAGATAMALSVLAVPATALVQEEEEPTEYCCTSVFGAECCGPTSCSAGIFKCEAN